MFERFTSAARVAVVSAQQAARERRDHWIGSEHLLLALAAAEPGDPARDTLDAYGLTTAVITAELRAIGPVEPWDSTPLGSLGIDVDELRERVEAQFGVGALDEPVAPRRRRRPRLFGDHLPFLDDAKQTLENALREAVDLGHREIRTGHVLLGLLRTSAGLGSRVIERRGVDVAELRRSIRGRIAEAA